MKWLILIIMTLIYVGLPTTSYTVNKTQEVIREKKEKKLKAIIFDIGNVLLEVNLELWTPAFKKIGVHLPDDILKDKELSELVYQYSSGEIDTKKFISKLSNKLEIEEIPFDKFKFAWNSVIITLYPDAIKALSKFRSQGYRIYALSDNNEMHTNYIKELYQKLHPNKNFFDLFDKAYLSQQTGFRKTNDQAWLYLLKEQQLDPAECLFVDDMASNIERAQKLGIHTFLYTPQEGMQPIFKKISEINQ